MSMNEAELAAVVEDLQSAIGAPLSGLWQPARDRVVVGLSGGPLLLLVPRGPVARIHSIGRRPKNPPRPFSFQGACRSRLRGRLVSLLKVPGDRIVRLEFTTGTLELRITGRSGGLWLLDDEEVVAAYDGPAPARLPPVAVRPDRQDQPRFEPLDGSMDRAADRYFTALERDLRARERRGLVERRLKRAIQRGRRLLGHLEQDLSRAEEGPEHRRRADLLAANLHRVERGAERIVLEDWETGQPVHVELDPGRPASDTLEQLYRRASRMERVADRVLQRMDDVEAELAQWAASLKELATADLESLEELERRLPALPSRGSDAQVVLPWSTWTGPRGERVLVGRHERGNRRLTFQVAKGTDWWMHIRGRPGAHLVLPMTRGQTPPLQHLLAAAQIALVHAKVPEGDAADVQYARVRDVRAIPGEGARVRIADERVLRVTRDASEIVGWVKDDL
ncbi:MAG: NFACT family protein [Myxococcales bacterium]|nr:NFACT family protein [Myxococcales bacterium]